MPGEERPAAGGSQQVTRKPIIKIDNFVRRHTESVDLETLGQKGLTRINCLTISKINDLISMAVMRAFQKYNRGLDESEARAVEAVVRSEVVGEIEKARRAVHGEASPAPVAARAPVEDAAADPVAIALESDLGEVETRVRSAVANALRSGAGEDGPGRPATDVERGVGEAVSGIFQAERERLLGLLDRASSLRTEILERRIDKMRRHLAELEEA